MKIFSYLALAHEIAEVVPQIIALTATGTLSAPALLATITPAISGLQSTFNVSLPPALVSDIVSAVADAVTAYHKPKLVPPAA